MTTKTKITLKETGGKWSAVIDFGDGITHETRKVKTESEARAIADKFSAVAK